MLLARMSGNRSSEFRSGLPWLLHQVFTEAFSRNNHLIKADPTHSTYLACGLLLRGPINISDINRNIGRLKPSMRMIHWNTEVREMKNVASLHAYMNHAANHGFVQSSDNVANMR